MSYKIFLKNFFHFVDHAHKSTSAHPLKELQQSSLYHLQFILLPPFHHSSYTTNSISFSKPPQLLSPFFHPQHPSTISSPSDLCLQSCCNLRLWAPGCVMLHLPFYGRHVLTTPTFGMKIFGTICFPGNMPLFSTNYSLQNCGSSVAIHSTACFWKCGG